MSIHFAPQWVKPIKPSGTSLTPTADHPPSVPTPLSKPLAAPTSTSTSISSPFPALSGNANANAIANAAANPRGSPTTNTAPNPPLSYSRVTHTPLSPNFPTDNSYFPYTEANGVADPKLAFRYSREQMLGMWEEEKVRELPIDLVQMLEDGGVLVSKNVVKPIGLREQTEVEKKLLATTVHPPALNRRQPINPPGDTQPPNGASRRPIGPPNPKDAGGRAGFGGFGRGEGGALGGTRFGTIGSGSTGAGAGAVAGAGAPGEGRTPGALGGGFGGVSRRLSARKTDAAEPESRTAASWRQTRTTSGSFEGVLGFGSAPGQPPQPPVEEAVPQTAPVGGWRDRFEPPKEAEEEVWGARTWKVEGVQEDKTLNIPASSLEISSDSIRATPSATPIPERDAAVETAAPSVAESEVISRQSSGPGQPREDFGAVQWFYRDPNSVEQGPFSGTTMHDWYSHSYFDDALPVRRASESSFHSLAELKAATGNAVQPFLSPLRPRALPPNLPIPAAFSSPNGHVADALKNLNVSPAPGDQRVSPAPQYATYNAFSPNQFAPQPFASPGFAQPQPWGMGAIGSPMGQPGFGFAARGPMMPNQPYSPVIGPPAPRDPFGPYGAPAAPWQSQPQPQQNAPVHPSSGPAWQAPGPQPPLEMLQQPPVPLQPVQPHVQPEQHDVGETAQELEPEPTPVEEAAEPETAVESEPEPEPEAEEVSVLEPEPETKAVPPPSVWGQKTTKTSAPSSRKNSILSPAPIAAQLPQTPSASKLPPAPASLPAKPLSARSGSVSESLPPKPVATPPAEKTPVSSKPAPWAVKDDTPRAVPTGPSLREIQEAEARQAEARKAALAEARAAASSPAPVALEDVPTSLSWGLPSSGSGKATTPVPTTTTPPAPAWGNGDAGPKKTLKQIQEEEEKRKAKVAQQANQARAAVAPTAASKRGYADLAANAPPGAGWTTVGANGPASPAGPRAAPRAPVPAKPAAVPSKPVVAPVPVATQIKPKTNGTPAEDVGPSVEFIRWTKSALAGLTVNGDDFIQMLLSFPVDPPASQKADVAEIIADSVYASSSTLDGRRFAQEFMTRRKADAARPNSGASVKGLAATAAGKVGGTSLADVVKIVPKPQSAESGFKVVKSKGKKKN